MNVLTAASALDFYKTDHRRQFPEGTTLVYSNETPRSDKHFQALEDFDHKIVNFGIQGVIKWLLIDLWYTSFFSRPKDQVIGRYKRRIERALNVKDFDVSHLEVLHDLGYLPIKIKALPEGVRVNIKVPTYTIVNTLPKFFWLTNYLETQLQAELWKVKTTATTAYEYRRLFNKYAQMTGVEATPEFNFVDWQGHDFSMRGMSGIHDAAQSGAGHLLSFKGTDTVSAIEYVEEYYGMYEEFVGGSVPATEHAVMCMGGKETEIETYERLITEVYPEGIVSIVSDTWDFWQVVSDFTVRLKDKIIARNGKVVLRPDSGDPVDIICGTVPDVTRKFKTFEEASEYYIIGDCPIGERFRSFKYNGAYYRIDKSKKGVDYKEMRNPTPEMKGAVECLWEIFGGTTTKTGHKTLDPHIGLIYGDSINLDRAKRILEGMEAKGFASNNIVFGIGSFTYQFVTRDTFGIAVKATFGVVNGEERIIFKKPKTDNGMKNSAAGLLRIEKEGDDYVLYDNQTWEQEAQGELRTIFENSRLIVDEKFTTIQKRLYAEPK